MRHLRPIPGGQFLPIHFFGDLGRCPAAGRTDVAPDGDLDGQARSRKRAGSTPREARPARRAPACRWLLRGPDAPELSRRAAPGTIAVRPAAFPANSDLGVGAFAFPLAAAGVGVGASRSPMPTSSSGRRFLPLLPHLFFARFHRPRKVAYKTSVAPCFLSALHRALVLLPKDS